MNFDRPLIENQRVNLQELDSFKISLFIKREDQIHPLISGNKYRKLKYNILKAQEYKYDTLLTFGGAFSNHISAVAFTGKEFGFKTIGVIRGDELRKDLSRTLKENSTLRMAYENDMQFEFVSRSDYRLKNSSAFINELNEKYGRFYLIPEGGTNELAVKGCQEILKPKDQSFDIICCAIGTGGTISGIINSINNFQTVLGFSSLKGDFLNKEIKKYVIENRNWSLINDCHLGGFAKVNEEFIKFMNNFKKETSIPLDPIYTGKMMYRLVDMIKNGHFKQGVRILAIHTGGLQGIPGMNMRLRKKNLPIIQ